MPDASTGSAQASGEARWKARYERIAAAHQKLVSSLARLEARIEAVEAVIAAKTVDVTVAARVAKADREATRKRRFQERVEAAKAARALRDKP
jgi:hypothetical protein